MIREGKGHRQTNLESGGRKVRRNLFVDLVDVLTLVIRLRRVFGHGYLFQTTTS